MFDVIVEDNQIAMESVCIFFSIYYYYYFYFFLCTFIIIVYFSSQLFSLHIYM